MAKIEIDLLDTSLDNSDDGDHEILGMVEEGSFGSGGEDKSHMAKFMDSGEDDVAYNYKHPSGGTVTYRLVHVGADEGGGGMSGAAPHYGHHTAVASTAAEGSPLPPQALHTVLANSVNGQLYVIGNPEVFGGTGNKPIIPRDTHVKGPNMKKRDDRRRMTHNEVERRRRDKINNWIVKLAKLMPPGGGGSGSGADTAAGEKCNGEVQSKGGILAKACEYIIELKDNEHRLEEASKENDRLSSQIVTLSMQIATLKRSNIMLRNQLSQNGIAPISTAEPPSAS